MDVDVLVPNHKLATAHETLVGRGFVCITDGSRRPPLYGWLGRYNQWLHYAEGSAMLPLMLFMYVGRLGEAAAPLQPRIESELANHLGYVEKALAGRDYILGAELTGADINLSFVGEVLGPFGRMAQYPNIKAWVQRFQARPAYKAALEKGGAYSYGSA